MTIERITATTKQLKETLEAVKAYSPTKKKQIKEAIIALEALKACNPAEKINLIFERILTFLDSNHLHPQVGAYFKDIREEGVPFIHFELEPANISQIKKIINALYHAHQLCLFIEKADLRSLFYLETRGLRENIANFGKNTISSVPFIDSSHKDYYLVNNIFAEFTEAAEHTFNAGYLLTHMDVDIPDLFKQELLMVIPLIKQFYDFIETTTESNTAKSLIEQIKGDSLKRKIGEITGIAIEQLQPISGEMDYDFITQFSAMLPVHIKTLSEYMEKFFKLVKDNQRSNPLNKETIEQLRMASLEILNDLEKIKEKRGLFASFKYLKYIHILNNIYTLSMSTYHQIGYLDGSLHEIIRDKLSLLKYRYLPALFILVDKIELNSMLKPGTLSSPLMAQMKKLYEGDKETKGLIYYVGKVINFSLEGEDLQRIENSQFLTLRLEPVYERIRNANKHIFQLEKAQEAFTKFYRFFEKSPYQDKYLYELPLDIQKRLLKFYRLISPYTQIIDPNFDSMIIDTLQNHTPIPINKRDVVDIKEALGNLLNKQKATQNLHIELNNYLIKSLKKQTNVVLSPYSDKENIFTINEETFITGSADELIVKHQKEEDAFNHFFALLENPQYKNLFLHELPEEVKKELLVHYQVIKPYASELHIYLNTWISKAPDSPQGNVHSLLSQKTNLEQFIANKKEDEQKIFNRFYVLLNNPLYRKKALHKLPSEVKEELLRHYLLLKPYFSALKLDFERMLKTPSNDKDTMHTVHFISLKEGALQKLISEKKTQVEKALSEFFKLLSESRHQNDALTQLSAVERRKLEAQYIIEPRKKDFSFEEVSEAMKKQIQTQYKIIAPYIPTAFILAQKTNLQKFICNRHPTLHYKKEGSHTLLTSEHLTSNQALNLSHWYQNKHQQLKMAHETYKEMMDLLGKNSSQGVTPFNLTPALKEKCRLLYSCFQVYFINSVPEEKKNKALEFDKVLVAYLSDMDGKIQAPSQNLFAEVDTAEFFTKQAKAWNKKEDFYLTLAKKQHALESEVVFLDIAPLNPRASYLLRHTQCSAAVKEFRAQLLQTVYFLNNSMKAELGLKTTLIRDNERFEPRNEGLPYPELSDENECHAQSKQVLAIKEIFNILYNVEEIMRNLEELDNDTSKIRYKERYFYQVILAGINIYKIWKLANKLLQDPHSNLVGQELIQKAKIMLETIQEHSESYQVSPDMVHDVEGTVQYSALWYPLNAFYIIPKHIRSVVNDNDLTVAELNELQQRAKKATLTIETVMKDSHSYFKLFLRSPAMLGLYTELKSKLNEFMSTVHDGMLSNVEKLGTKVFIPMLLEADQWEARLGLMPGLISGPLKKIVDEYYKGLLGPLKLTSEKHIGLICYPEPDPLKERIKVTKKIETQAIGNLAKLEKNASLISHLFDLIQSYKPKYSLRPQPLLEEKRKELIAAYKQALPKLVALKKKINFEPDPLLEQESLNLDNMLNASLKDYDPKLVQIRKLVSQCHYYYLGKKASYKMAENTAKEKLTYLEGLRQEQEQANKIFIKEYTAEAFDKVVEAFSSRQVGLQWVGKEYKNKLEKHLLSFKPRFVEEAHTEKDINEKLKTLLKMEIQLYEKKHFAQFSHLDNIQAAIAKFRVYFTAASTAVFVHNNSLFENEQTLKIKTARIDALSKIVEDTNTPLPERIDQIQKLVKDPGFERVMLGHKNVSHFSFAYLKILLLSLFEAVGLYTSDRSKLYKGINKAVKNEPTMSELTSRFGLFTEATPKEKEAAPPAPAASPAA